MINLLPPAIKEEYGYALRNSQLMHWVTALVVAMIGLGVVATYGLATIKHSTNTYTHQVATLTKTLDDQKLSETKTQVTDITNSFKLVVEVLSKEVLFSKLLKQVATVIPQNATLANLNFNQTTGGVDITANAADYNTATQIQVNLADPANKIFSKADIVSIACSVTATNPKYPCTVQIRALFATQNQFLFVNNSGGTN